MSPGPFSTISIPVASPTAPKRRYSLTSDVVAFRRCPRQYGAFNVHAFAPAHQTQIYFGTVLHQVLDRCHAHFKGLENPATRGQFPDGGAVLPLSAVQAWFDAIDAARSAGVPAPPPPTDIIRFFVEVEDALRSRGIRAVSPTLRKRLVSVLQNFNALEGPTLYPKVVDTEHRLQADEGSHILHGVVDLLADPAPGAGIAGDREIWDYKGVDPAHLSRADRDTYRYQMLVYAHLYERKHGVLPRRALLYFLNELHGEPRPKVRPANAVLEVPLNAGDVGAAVASFAATVSQIELARARDCWPEAAPGTISSQDCDICDLRWDCPTAGPPTLRIP